MAASAASPSSAAVMSDIEPPSSPVHAGEKSFMTAVTEDEDTKMAMATPDPSERAPRGSRKRAKDDAGAQNGSVIGKIRHLKKEDGEPLWRKDIQYDFLKAVFDDEQKMFTNSYEPEKIGKQCFADLYIDTMSRSSKTSKVLRDKLLSDRDAAKGMAMVCLLVNIGRMNTTLNFFPEMRAQLRTYHAIPSLQARQDPHAYKQLQDAPRLKSILKGGAEDRAEPSSLDDLKYTRIPRTNPVNLLFVICQAASKIAELHFPPGREFHDLIMKSNYTSRSRARAFLWIMWFYLESDFTEEGCEENPFGAGVDYGVDVANQGVPRLELMTPEEEARENVDTQEEIDFGFAKQKMRAKIIEADQQFMVDSQNKRGGRARGFPAGDEIGPTTGILPRIRPSKHESDIDSVRSTPPPRALGARQSGVFGNTSRRGANPLKYQIFEGSSPGGGHVVEGIVARKPRPPTAHQLAVERNRSQRVEYILDRGIRKSHHKSRKLRRIDGSIIRALYRLQQVESPFDDSEDEQTIDHNKQALLIGGPNSNAKIFPFREKGYGGLCQLRNEEDDFGEEFASFGAALRRSHRRLCRWENYSGPEPLGVIAPIKRPKANGVGEGHGDGDNEEDDNDHDMYGDGSPSKEPIDPAETEDEAEALLRQMRSRQSKGRARVNGTSGRGRGRGRVSLAHGISASDIDANGDTQMDEADDLDDVDKELLGLGDGEAEGEGEADEGEDGGEDAGENEDELDDVDKTLLGMDGDTDSEQE
ncbi:hypothetical protein QBC46DRAFT_445564 [Diplogelasinospora grovesii]|uniref:INO80 chromatin remodeling complex Ies1 n=1 Tax=Diplogelasinospora grovesii TaxID=303347 RepID=A0AAN6S988_9PEZI|nr:hypothetical protein QBC46DRAFT_445564 [Diplogelasinospora grovesii]